MVAAARGDWRVVKEGAKVMLDLTTGGFLPAELLLHLQLAAGRMTATRVAEQAPTSGTCWLAGTAGNPRASACPAPGRRAPAVLPCPS